MNNDELIELVSLELTETRLDHSLDVAKISKEFSVIYGYPHPEKAYIAGLLHDITKQKQISFHIEMFEKNQFDYSNFPENAYHSFSAAMYIVDKMDIYDEEILSAVSNHTLGKKDMPLLDKILYVSDFLGSSYCMKHKKYSDWMSKCKKNIYYGLYLKSSQTIQELLEKKMVIHCRTFDVYNDAVRNLK